MTLAGVVKQILDVEQQRKNTVYENDKYID